jgi:hypothetical protein
MSPSRAWTSSCTAKDSSPSSSLILGVLLAALLAPCQLSLRLRDHPNRHLSSPSALNPSTLSSMPSTELLSRVDVTIITSLINEPQLLGQSCDIQPYDVPQSPTFTYATPLKHKLRASPESESTLRQCHNTTTTRSSSNHGGCSSATYPNASTSSLSSHVQLPHCYPTIV